MKPWSRKPFGALALSLLLPACATVATPEYPRQHPANPDAIQVPAPTASSALDAYRPAPARKDQPRLPASLAEPAGQGNSAQDPADEPGKDDHDHH